MTIRDEITNKLNGALKLLGDLVDARGIARAAKIVAIGNLLVEVSAKVDELQRAADKREGEDTDGTAGNGSR